MSRYTLTPSNPGISAVCGWDGPLESFFATVTHQPERDDDNVIFWVGTSRREILRPDDLIAQLKPYAEIDEATMSALRRDRAEATVPTALQRFGASLGVVEPILLISGFGRCGSSLVMQMLAAGGYPVTGQFPGFEDDIALLGGRHDAASWTAHAGKAVKVLDPHHFDFPAGVPFRAVWLDRNRREQAKSHAKFLRAMMNVRTTRRHIDLLAASYAADRTAALAKLRGVADHVTILAFEDILRHPAEAAARLAEAAGRALDVKAMAAVVRPRTADCLPGLLELELLRERGMV